MARPAGDINAGSMADIAFLILIYFLMTTTMDIDTGLIRRLPPMQETPDKNITIHRRNIMAVQINLNDRLFAGNQPMDVSMLREAVKEFIMNPANDPGKPEIELQTMACINVQVPVSKGVISLQNDRGTSYDAYIAVQNELVAAYTEMRDDFSRQHFGKIYTALTDDQQDAVRKAIPQTISEAEPVDKNIKKKGGH
jgi:biopolymer transport protein ExbD